MQYTCENCGMRLDSATAQIGSLERCPSCGQINTVPDVATIPESADPAVLSYATAEITEIRYAGFWIRFCAEFIDGLVLGIPSFIVGLVVGGLLLAGGGTSPMASAGSMIVFKVIIGITGLVIGWVYSALMVSSRHQATLGKLAVKVFVTDGNGDRLTFGGATKRHIIKNIGNFVSTFLGFFVAGNLTGMQFASMGVLWIWLAGYVVAAFHSRKRALHDMLADTYVRIGKADQVVTASDLATTVNVNDFDNTDDADQL